MLNGYKTYIASVVSLIAGVYLYATGSIDIGILTSIISVSAIGSGLRASK